MNLENIKLVVSDMDGTLLNNNHEVSPLFFKLFKKLQSKNINFCAASGRQYNSIIEKLHPIKDAIYVIAENGAIAKKGNTTLLTTPLSKEKLNIIVPFLKTIPDAHVVICTEDNAFIDTKDANFVKMFKEYYVNYTIVNNILDIINSKIVLKIAIYHQTSTEQFVNPFLKNYKNDFLLKISGKNWLDISSKKANKGQALKHLQQQLNITKNNTLVFGDYHNDIEMLQESDFSFAMENAHKDVKNIAKYSTKSNAELGVEHILKRIVETSS